MKSASNSLAEAQRTILVGNVKDYEIPDDVLQRWREHPAAVGDDELARYSDGGYVFQNGDALPCPVTLYRQQLGQVVRTMKKQGIPERYLHTGWGDLEMVAPFPRLKRGAEHIDRLLRRNASLMLFGPSGTGKTQSAMLLARAALEAGASVLVVNLADMAIDVRMSYDDTENNGTDIMNERKAIDELVAPDLLVLEDLGAGETANATVEKRLLYHATEKRQNASKPVIITTNLSPEELKKLVGGRILGRLQPLSVVEFSHGKNFRAPDLTEELW